jgi:hypothetical protein
MAAPVAPVQACAFSAMMLMPGSDRRETKFTSATVSDLCNVDDSSGP